MWFNWYVFFCDQLLSHQIDTNFYLNAVYKKNILSVAELGDVTMFKPISLNQLNQ